MSVRGARLAVAAFFLAYLLAVTWPVGTLFGGPEPFVLGLPFSFFWPALWIVMGGAALALLDRVEERYRDVDGPGGGEADPTGSRGPGPTGRGGPDPAARGGSGPTGPRGPDPAPDPEDARGGHR